MGELAFKYHPVLEELQVNEDGTVVLLHDKELNIHTCNIGQSKTPTQRVYVDRRTINIKKLVCECWHGMRPDMSHCARMVDATKGTHYTNLAWAVIGGNCKEVRRHVKIPVEDLPKIEQRLNAGETLMSIAKDYGVSDMTISRIKNKFKESNV